MVFHGYLKYTQFGRRPWRRQRSSSIEFYEQTNNFELASHFLAHFFNVHCTITTWNDLIWRFMGVNENTRRRIQFPFSFQTWLQSRSPGKFCLHLTNWVSKLTRLSLTRNAFLRPVIFFRAPVCNRLLEKKTYSPKFHATRTGANIIFVFFHQFWLT